MSNCPCKFRGTDAFVLTSQISTDKHICRQMSSGWGHFIISSLSLADEPEFWAQFKLWSVTISNHYCLSCFEPFLKGLAF